MGHDWGLLIGLRWARDHRGAVAGLVISNGASILADGRWHSLAAVMRTEQAGERFMAGLTRERFRAALLSESPAVTREALPGAGRRRGARGVR